MFGRVTGTPANDGPWNTPSVGGNPLTSTTLPGGGALLGSSLQVRASCLKSKIKLC